MTDREMILFLYGVLKLTPNARADIVRMVEKHLGMEATPPPPLMVPASFKPKTTEL